MKHRTVCNIQFKPKKLNANKYCSHKCYWQNPEKYPIIVRACRICNKRMETRRQYFCSRTCYWQSMKGNAKPWNKGMKMPKIFCNKLSKAHKGKYLGSDRN